MPNLKVISPIAAALLLSACATVPPPDDAIGDAEAAIERAADARAREFAAFELAQAGRKLEEAKQLSSGESEQRLRARRLAQQARLDARLAEEQARLGRTRQTYDELREAVDGGRSVESTGEKGGAQ